MSQGIQIFNEKENVFFEKLLNRILKKEYPYFSKVVVKVPPRKESSEDLFYSITIYINPESIRNSEIAQRHVIDMDEYIRKKEISNWDIRLFFHPNSINKLSEKVEELITYVKPSYKKQYFNIGKIEFEID